MRRSSCLVAADAFGSLLLQHRTDDAPTWPGRWGLFGGGREEGEDARQTLIRELREEIGLDAGDSVHVGVVTTPEVTMDVFFLRLSSEQSMPHVLARGQTEGQGLGFFPFEAVRRMNVVPEDVEAMLLALRSLGR
jgi:8-oxo-dGTP pyrophosphatase MutT (NUDIX family)